MAIFYDSHGRRWSLVLTLGKVSDLRREGIDLGKAMGEPQTLARFLYADPDQMGRMFWVLLADQVGYQSRRGIGKTWWERLANRFLRGLSPEDFEHIFDPPTLAHATMAMEEAIIDFFQKLPKTREAMKKSLREIQRKIDLSISSVMSGSDTASAPSSGSTQDRSGLGN